MGDDLDKHHPFGNTAAVEIIIQAARSFLEPEAKSSYSRAIWGLTLNFIALDRLCATFGAAAAAPSQPVPRTHCERIAIGTALQVSISLLTLAIVSHSNISS